MVGVVSDKLCITSGHIEIEKTKTNIYRKFRVNVIPACAITNDIASSVVFSLCQLQMDHVIIWIAAVNFLFIKRKLHSYKIVDMIMTSIYHIHECNLIPFS